MATSTDEVTVVHNVASAAAYARRHEKTILAALRRGELTGYQKGRGCTWRIYQPDLDRWIRGERPIKSRRSA